MTSFIFCLPAPPNSNVEAHCTHGKTKRIWKDIRTEMCMTKIQIQRIWKVICTECALTKTDIQRNGSHSYRNVYDENP